MRSCRWIPETGAGLEHLVLWQEGAEWLAQGVVIGERDGPAHGTAYTLRCDPAWRLRQASIDRLG